MKKKIMALVLATSMAISTEIPVLACTPPLHLDMPQISNIKWEPDEKMQEAIKKSAEDYVKEHPIDLDKKETDETVEESEQVIGTISVEKNDKENWHEYISDSWRKRLFSTYR